MRRSVLAAVSAALLLGACGDDTPPRAERLQSDGGRTLAAPVCPPTPPRDAVDGGLPELSLPCLGDGPDVNLADLRGPMVVNLWASWCGPCREEMPLLQAFHERYGERVPVLGIDWQDPQEDSALELAADSGVTYPLVADVEGNLGSVDGMPIRGLPGIVLIDADGRVAYRNLEVIETEQDLVDLVDEHLGVAL